AVHPVHTEAVAYVAGRADSLYSLFMLLSFVLFIKSVKSAPKGARSNLGLYATSILFFVLSLLSKEMVMVMPLLAFLYMFYFLRGTENNQLYNTFKWRWAPYALIIVVYGILRTTVLSFADIAPASAFFKIPFLHRFLTFSRCVAVYFRLLVFPADLHMERSIRITKSLFDIESFLALIMMAGIAWIAYKTYKSGRRVISFGIAWFFVNLLPVSNIVPINSFLAEHWIYMACIGPLMLVGLVLAWLWNNIPLKGRSLRIGFVLAFVFSLWLYMHATITRNKDWNNEISFFHSTLEYHPTNARLYLNLGNTYYEKGEIDMAIEQYQNSITINKDYAVAYGNIGSAYLHKKDIDKAEEYLTTAVELKDNYPIAHYNLGIIAFKKGRYNAALKELTTATEQLPQLYQAWNMMARTYLKVGKPTEAKKAFQRSLAIMPEQASIRRSLEQLEKLPLKQPPPAQPK
ncbi:tetratricopeptide repeat protein, partial [Candidatus Omnitrophota bacterium]